MGSEYLINEHEWVLYIDSNQKLWNICFDRRESYREEVHTLGIESHRPKIIRTWSCPTPANSYTYITAHLPAVLDLWFLFCSFCPPFSVLVCLLELVLHLYWAGQPCMIPVGKYKHTKPPPDQAQNELWSTLKPGSPRNGCFFHCSYFLMFWSYFIFLELGCECLYFSMGILESVAAMSSSSYLSVSCRTHQPHIDRPS